jgi:membrane-bound ClpP family serine protease
MTVLELVLLGAIAASAGTLIAIYAHSKDDRR